MVVSTDSEALMMILHKEYEDKGFHLRNQIEKLIPGSHFQGSFRNGQASGHFWVEMEGGGHLHGQVSSDGLISGNEIAYIYPGAKLALIGKFKSNVMVAGQKSRIIQATCKKNMVSLLFDKPEGKVIELLGLS